jgi:hypothetical protein
MESTLDKSSAITFADESSKPLKAILSSKIEAFCMRSDIVEY